MQKTEQDRYGNWLEEKLRILHFLADYRIAVGIEITKEEIKDDCGKLYGEKNFAYAFS